jgi:4-oxalocrotonate tautomerase
VPIVNIVITREGSSPDRSTATAEEKARLIAGVSELLRDVLGKPLEATFVTIQEVETENWGWGGLPVEEFRRRAGGLPPPGRRPE